MRLLIEEHTTTEVTLPPKLNLNLIKALDLSTYRKYRGATGTIQTGKLQDR